MQDRIALAALSVASAVIVAGILYYIAYNEFGASRETIRQEALILAGILGIGLMVIRSVRERSK
jgi:hypothetical protein